MQTKGIIFAIKETREEIKNEVATLWCKISWCHMTRKEGKGSRWKVTQRRKSRRKRKRKNKKKEYFEVKNKSGTPICTWIRRKSLTLGVLNCMEDGAVSSGRLSCLKLSDRQVTVDARAHPLTMKSNIVSACPLQRFLMMPEVTASPTATAKQTVRICFEDFTGEESDIYHPPESGAGTTPPKKKSRNSMDPEPDVYGGNLGLRLCEQDGFEHDFDWFVTEYGEDEGTKMWNAANPATPTRDGAAGKDDGGDGAAGKAAGAAVAEVDVDADAESDVSDFFWDPVPATEAHRIDNIMKQLNNALRSVPKKHSKEDVIEAYNDLLKLPGWRTRTDASQFPINRFGRHLDTTFPEKDNMIVSQDGLKWTCSLCKGSGQDVTKAAYHKQNVSRHFRSHEHCMRVASLCNTSEAVQNAVDEDREKVINTSDIARAVTDDAVISCARKALSFTAVPIAMQVAARAIIMCRGTDAIKIETIKKVREVSKRAASVLERINACVALQAVRGDRQRPSCVRGRHWVAERMIKLGQISLQKKVEFLLSCPYLSCSADESDTFSGSAPLAAALQGCAMDFKWGNLFMGQHDVAHDKTGEGCFNALRDLLHKCHPDLLQLIVWTCFDGASAMRSTSQYAGLDGKQNGISLLAYLKEAIDDDLPNLHGLCHQGDLALKHSLKQCRWAQQWLLHLRGVYNWFKRSPAKKSALKRLHKTMIRLEHLCTWTFCYPKYPCDTRWIGIHDCSESILKTADLILFYVDKLVLDGYLPYRVDDEEEEDEAPEVAGLTLAQQAAANESDSEEDADDNEDTRAHKDSFYQWGTDKWDLVVLKPTDDDEILNSDQLVDLETEGRAHVWKDLATGTKKTRCKLLSEKIGFTTLNFGITSVMADVLKPYKVLTQRLQAQYMPIAHRVRKYISDMFRIMNRLFLSDEPTFGKHYAKWTNREDVSEDMRNQVKAMGRQFVFHFLTNMRYRFQPYWKVIMAMETINPCAPAHLSPKSWDGVRELVRRCMTDVPVDDVVDQLKRQQEMAADWSLGEIKACTKNLLRYYHDRLAACKQHSRAQEYPLADQFARLIFSLHVASSVIETYFSKTKFIKRVHRASMRDELATATLHVQQLRAYMNDDVLETISNLGIDVNIALSTIEHDLEQLRKKYVGKSMAKNFKDETRGGVVRPYKGKCTDAFFSKEDGHYLFHVSYNSDSDSEDMEQWEISKCLVDDDDD